MSKDELETTPADTARERAAFADQAEALLRRILGALGYDAAEHVTTHDLVAAMGAWLGLVTLASAEPTSPAAHLWQAIYDAALRASPMADTRARREEARQEADEALLAFVRRFPPRFEPVDRQSLDDLAAMREALDEQTAATEAARDLVAEWQSRYVQAAERVGKAERDLAELRALVASSGTLIPQPKPERVEPGQRWAFVMISTGQVDHFANRRAWKLEGESGRYWCAMPENGSSVAASMYYLGPAPTAEA